MSKTEQLIADQDSNQDSNMEVYGRILTYTKQFWLAIMVGVIGFALYAATQTAFAKLLEYIITSIEQQNAQARSIIPVAIIAIFIVRGIGSFLGSYGISYAARHIIHTLRLEMFNNLVHLPHRFFNQQTPGHLVSKFTYDVEQISSAASDAVKILFRETFTVIGLLAFLFYSNWQLSLVFLLVAPLIGVTVNFASKRFREVSQKIQNSMGSVTHVVSESIQGEMELKTFGGEVFEKERFFSASKGNLRQSMKLVVASAVNTPVIQLIVAFALALLVWLAMDMMADASAGEFAAYIAAASLLAKPIRQLTQVNAKIQKGIAAAVSVFALIDEEQEKDTGSFVVDRVQGKIEYRNVSFAYHDEDVLRNINFQVSCGETIALVGRSGAGKSTLVQLLNRFYDPGQGEILIDDKAVADYKLSNLRQQIAIVSQKFTLFNATVAENIAYGIPEVSAEDIRQAASKAHAIDFIEQLSSGFNTLVGHDGTQLSGGQRQRIAIARAILKDAPILVLDEATSALDTESERHIQAALENVVQGRTTFIIAHRLSTVENADRIFVMDKGEIIEQGSHQDLLAKEGHYAQLSRLQFSDQTLALAANQEVQG